MQTSNTTLYILLKLYIYVYLQNNFNQKNYSLKINSTKMLNSLNKIMILLNFVLIISLIQLLKWFCHAQPFTSLCF